MAPEPSEHVKAILRSTLPVGLTYPESKIRNSIAAIISVIAHWDWPEQWPNLFDVIVQYLKNEKVNILMIIGLDIMDLMTDLFLQSVAGAMRVLVEFVKELTEDSLLQLGPVILPEMCVMINDKSTFTSNTRARAVAVFRYSRFSYVNYHHY